MFKRYSLYFKTANYLILLHGLGHYYGHLETFVNYNSASPALKAVYESMQGATTGGGNNIWALFLMFSASYTIFQVMIAVINLILVYSISIQLEIMKRVVLANLVLWTASLLLLYFTTAINLTLISQAVFCGFLLISYLLIRNN